MDNSILSLKTGLLNKDFDKQITIKYTVVTSFESSYYTLHKVENQELTMAVMTARYCIRLVEYRTVGEYLD